MAKYNVSKSEAKRLGIKRVKIGSSKKSSSKDRGGLSKREYAASQASKASQAKSSSSSSSNSMKKYTDMGWAQGAAAYKRDRGIADNEHITGSALDLAMKAKYQPGSVQGPLTADGKFYSKDSSNSSRNKAVTAYRNQGSSSSSNKSSGSASGGGGGGSWDDKKTVTPSKLEGVGGFLKSLLSGDLFKGFDPSGLSGKATGPITSSSRNSGGRGLPSSTLEDELRGSGGRGLPDYQDKDKIPQFTEPGNETSFIFDDEGNTRRAPQRATNSNNGNVEDDYNRPSPQKTSNDYTPRYKEEPINQFLDYFGKEKSDFDAPRTPDPIVPEQPDPGNTIQQKASTGFYGNGASLGNMGGFGSGGNNYADDAEDWMEGQTSSIDKQIENLIKSLDPRYAEEERLGTDKLNEGLTQALMSLGSRFGSANTADSEQRVQYEGIERDNMQSQLVELLARLSAAKQQEISGFQQQGMGLKQDVANKYQDLLTSGEERAYQRSKDLRDYNYKVSQGNRSSGSSSGSSIAPRVQAVMDALGVSEKTATAMVQEDLGMNEKEPVERTPKQQYEDIQYQNLLNNPVSEKNWWDKLFT